MIVFLYLVVATLGIACVTTFFLSRSTNRFQIMDHPNSRSLHSIPTSRMGGIGIWAGAVAGMAIVALMLGWSPVLSWIAAAAIIVGSISLLDDRSHIPVRLRLVFHLVAALVLLSGALNWQAIILPGTSIGLNYGISLFVSAIFIVWMTNLYNFMDGMDGFAGGMTVIGFGTLGLLGLMAGDCYYTSVCWVIAAASSGFLVWNFPPARIFMGDAGSSALGLMAAALSLWADRDDLFPLWMSVLVFTPFVFDASLTLARRTLQGERIWEAHRNHYYQRLVQAGWSHRRTVLCEYGLMLLCGAGALAAFHAPPLMQWFILGGVMCVCLAAVSGVRRLEFRRDDQSSEAAL